MYAFELALNLTHVFYAVAVCVYSWCFWYSTFLHLADPTNRKYILNQRQQLRNTQINKSEQCPDRGT